MDGVGTQQGYVHNQRQGTGLATVLTGGDLAATTWIKGAQDDAERRRAAKQERDKQAMSAVKAITDFNPEFWYAHDAEIKGKLNEWQDKGTAMLQSGRDPWNSMDEDSVNWRKEYSRIRQMSTYSGQIKSEWEATRPQLDGKEADKYTPESIIARKQFFDQKVENTLETGVKPPALIERTPFVNRHDTWNKIMKTKAEQNPGAVLDDTQLAETAKAALEEPEMGPKLMRTYDSALTMLSPEEKTALQERADNSGRSTYQQMAFEDAKREQINQKPFDATTWLKSGADQVPVSTTTSQGPGGGSTTVKKKELEASARAAAKRIIENDPRALKFYDKPGLVPRDGDNDAEYRVRVEDYVTQEIIKTKQQSTAFQQTEKGAEDAAMKQSRDLWLSHMIDKGSQFYNEAAGYTWQGKGFIGDMTITNATVRETIKDNNPYRELVIVVEGSPTMKSNKEDGTAGLFGPEAEQAAAEQAAKDAGLPDAKYVQIGTQREFVIPITTETENQLLRVHDLAFKTTKQPYTGAKTMPGYQYPGGTGKTNPVTPPPGNWQK
jgi:hypothetical protein